MLRKSRLGVLVLALFAVIAGLVVGPAAEAATGVSVLQPGQVEVISPAGATLTTPADGRLRGPDFTAVVTGVGWPTVAGATPDAFVAGAGHRLVVFALSVTQPTADVGTGSDGSTTATAALDVDGTDEQADLSEIDEAIEGASADQTTGTGSEIFVASVPVGFRRFELTPS